MSGPDSLQDLCIAALARLLMSMPDFAWNLGTYVSCLASPMSAVHHLIAFDINSAGTTCRASGRNSLLCLPEVIIVVMVTSDPDTACYRNATCCRLVAPRHPQLPVLQAFAPQW